MIAASLKALVEVNGVPQASAKLREFQAKLKEVSTGSATADLQAKLETRGFDEYAAKIDEAKVKAARPITQTVKVDYKSAPVQAAIRDFKRLEGVMGGSGGNKGLGKGLGEALTPFGKLPSVLAAASPLLIDVAGGLTAIAGSAAEAAAGVGALGIAAGGVASVGLAGIVAIAVPAMSGLKKVSAAQKKYTEEIKLYGGASKQAATALAKLHLATSETGPAALSLVKTFDQIKGKWGELTKSGQNDFLGIGADALKRFQSLMPQFASSANSSVSALREGFDAFQKQVTGPGFSHFLETMTGTFARVVPEIGHGLADWAQIFMRIADAAAPSLEKVVHLWEHWSGELLKSTGDSKGLEKTISGLVDQAMSWVHLLGAAGHLLIAVFSSGAGEGKRLVDDLTGKLKEWTGWIEGHGSAVHEFFKRSADTTRELFTVLAGLVPEAYQFAVALMPLGEVFLSITKAINGLKIGNVSALTALVGAYVGGNTVQKISSSLGGLRKLAGPLGMVSGAEVSSVVGAGASGEAASGALAAAPALGPWLAVGAAIAAAGAGVYLLYKHSQTFREIVSPITTAAVDGFHEFERAVAPLGDTLKELGKSLRGRGGLITEAKEIWSQIHTPVEKVAELFKVILFGQIKNAVEEIGQVIRGIAKILSGQVEVIRGVIEVITGLLHGNFSQAWQGVKTIFAGGVKEVTGVFQTLTAPLVNTVKNIGTVLSAAFGGVWTKIESVFTSGINAVIGLVNDMIGLVNELPFVHIGTIGTLGAHSTSTGGLGKSRSGNSFSRNKRAMGGIVSGQGEGDIVPALLPPETFVMNKKATAALHYASGGHVPVMIEPGEQLFLPHEVKKHGLRNLEAINAAVPRFSVGGFIEGAAGTVGEGVESVVGTAREVAGAGLGAALGALPTPHIGQPFDGVANYVKQELVDYVKGKAKSYHKAHAGGVNLAGISGSVASMAAQIAKRAGAPHNVILALFEALWAESSMGAAAPGNVLEALEPYTKIRPAAEEISGFLTGHPTWTGTTAMSLARSGMQPYEIAQAVQKSGAGEASNGLSNYGAQKARALATMAKFGLQQGGLVKFANGGLVGEAERESGVPQSSSTSGPSASDAVHWAMQHLGSTDQWGYPGEWCGAFLGADMSAIGLTPPSGFPAASAWASYGTPLSKGHMQAGAILDYGSAHVAMAISSSEQIQGNNSEGKVGTSGIGGTIGGSPLTAVRWPHYASGPGAGSKVTETVPGVFNGAHTKALNLPSIPKSLRGIDKEIHRWTKELHVYEAAAKAATGKPATQRAIQANIAKITKYLRELQRARAKKHSEVAKRRFTGKLGKALGKITGYEQSIEGAARAYNIANQNAEQIVGLEPREPAEGGNLTAYLAGYEKYVHDQEGPAYQTVLEREADWRNLILTAESKATGLEGNWEAQIRGKDAMIAEIPKNAAEVRQRVAEWKKKHPKAKALPTTLARELANSRDNLAMLPMLRFEDQGLRKVLGEGRAEFYGGVHKPIQPPAAPLAGTGALEGHLEEVQGIHWPDQHERLAASALAPPRHAGSFGGAIWQTQEAIEELGLKIAQVKSGLAGSGGGTSEREQLLETLLRQKNQASVVRGIEQKTMGEAVPYAGGYASGGMVRALVGERGPEYVDVPTGSWVHNAHDTSRMQKPQLRIHVHGDIHSDREDPIEAFLNDERVDTKILAVTGQQQRRSARSAGRGLARAGV